MAGETKFVLNGVEYFGKSIKIKGGHLYIDGHLIADFNNNDSLEVSGDGVIETDKTVVINGMFSGTINAKTVVANDSDVIGTVNAEKIVYNK